MVIVLARHLGDDGYGRYTTLIAYSALVSVIADLGLSPLYTRETARQPGRLPDYLATLLSGKVLLAAAASVIFAVALAVSGLVGLVAPGAALLVLTTYANPLRNTFYALGPLEFHAIALLAQIAIQAALILAAARKRNVVSFFVCAYAASFGFTCLYSLTVITVFRLGRLRLGFDRALFFSWLRLAFPFALGAFLTNLY